MKSMFTRVTGATKSGVVARKAPAATRAPLAFALEPRFMFDAAGAATAVTTTADHTAPGTPNTAADLTTGSDSGAFTSDNVTKTLAPTVRVFLAGTDAVAGDTLDLLLGASALGTPKTKTLDSTDIGNGYVDFTIASGDLGGDGSKVLTARVADAAGNVGTAGASLTVTLDTTLPMLALAGGSLSYTEKAAATAIDAAATVTETGSPGGSVLTVQITANNEAADTLSITTTNSGGIWLDATGHKVMGGATQVATASADSVTNGTTWTITFLSIATATDIRDTVRAILYSNSSNNPGTSNRTVTVNLTDGAGNAATAATRSIAVTAVNDAPTDIALTGGTVSTYDSTDASTGTLSATDLDNNTWTFTIISVKDPSNATASIGLFGISGSTLTAPTPSGLAVGAYTVQVQADDGAGGTYQKDLSVTASNALVVTVNDDATDNFTTGGTYAQEVADGGGLSLREAVALANVSGGTISFAAGLAGQTLTLTNDVTISQNVTFDADTAGTLAIELNPGKTISIASGRTLTLTNGTGHSLTLSGNITGAGNLVKAGDGTLVLSGNNSYSGNTTVSAGTLSITDDSSLGSDSATVTLNGGNLTITDSGVTIDDTIILSAGATITNANAVTLSGVLSGAEALTKDGAGTLTLSGTNTHSGAVTVSAGRLTLVGGSSIGDSAAVTVDTGATLTLSGGAETIGSLGGAGSVVLGYRLTTGGNNTNTTFSGVISGGGNGITKTGTGTLTLSGNNSYTGSTMVSRGTLIVDRTGGALDNTTAVSVASGATFEMRKSETIGSIAGAGTVSLNAGTLTVGGNNGSTEISGVLSGSGNLEKAGSGTLTLSGSNTYSGTTTVSAGTLEVKNAAALGTAAGAVGVDGTTVASGAALTIQGGINLAEALMLSGTGMSAAGALVNVSGANTLSGVVTLGANTIIGATAGTLTLSGVVSGGSNTLTKIGTGTLTMTAVNTYTGLTTVSAGTLAGTTTLGGGLTVAGGATLAPGVAGTNNGIGTLTVNGAFTLNGALVAEVAGPSSYDQVIVSGTVTLNSSTSSAGVSRVNSYTAANGATVTLIDNDSNDAVSSTFTGVAEGADLTTNSDIYTVRYASGTNSNDVVLTAVVNPQVSSVSASTADGSYKAGDTLSITVIFNRAVTVTGSPTLALGNNGRTATYSGGSGGTVLTFTYTVQAGDTSADLDCLSTSALSLNGGGIVDSTTSLIALLTLAAPGTANSLGANKAIVIDTTAPAASSAPEMTAGSDTGNSSTDNITRTTTPTFTGTAEANSTVTLYGTDGTTVLGIVTADGSGNWSITSTTLSSGTHTITAKAADAAGNISGVSSGLSITIDTSAPSAPGTPTMSSGSDTGTSATDGVTRTTTPTFTGTAEAGSTVTLYGTDGTTVLGTGTADGAGNYSITVSTLTTGTHSVTAKATDSAGNVSNVSAGQSLTIDTTAPTVSSVTASTANGTHKAGDAITITVAFSEVVHVTGTPTLALNSGGTATYAGGSGSSTLTFTYTVGNGQTAADLDYGSTGALSGTIRDTAGNSATLTLPATGGGSSLGGSKDIVIDTTAPTVFSVTVPADGIYRAGQALDITVTFSEAVTVDGTPTLPITLDNGEVVQAGYVSGSGGTALTFRCTVGTDKLDINGIALASALTGGMIKDAVGNAATLTLNNVAGTGGVRVDSVMPTVSSVTSSTANGTHTTGDTVTIRVTFSEAVTVTDMPTLVLNTGRTATYSGGSGGNVLTFTYTVQAGDNSADLDASGSEALSGTIRDAAGNSAPLTLPNPGDTNSLGDNKNIAIDTTPPTIQSLVVPADGMYGIGKTLSFFVQVSEAVTITNGTPTIQLAIGGTVRQAVYSAMGSTSSMLRFDYVVRAGDTDLDGIAVTGLSFNGATVTDAARAALTATLTNLPDTQGVLIDTATPATPSIPVLGNGQDSGTVATDGLTNVNRPTIGGTAEAGSTVTVLVDGVARGTATADGNGQWTFAVATPLAEGVRSITTTATDKAGNVSTASPALVLTIDATAPVPTVPGLAAGSDNGFSATDRITSVTRPTLTGTSEPDSIVSVTLDGVVVGTVTAGADGQWSFAVATALSDGAHRIQVSATDAVGNVGTQLSDALVVTVDTRGPTVSVGGTAPSLGTGATVSIGTGLSLSDASALDRVTVTLTDPRTGDELVIGALPGGITVARDGNRIVLSGVASAADYQAAVRAIALRSSATDPSFAGTAPSRSISVAARDAADNEGGSATITVTVPGNAVPATAPTTANSGMTTITGNGPSTNSSSDASSSNSSFGSFPSAPTLPGSLGTTGNGPSSTDAGRSVTLGNLGSGSSSTDAGRSVTLSSVGGQGSGGSSSSSSGLSGGIGSPGSSGGSMLGGGLGGGLLGAGSGGVGGSVLSGGFGGLGGSGLGNGLPGGTTGGTGFGTAPGTGPADASGQPRGQTGPHAVGQPGAGTPQGGSATGQGVNTQGTNAHTQGQGNANQASPPAGENHGLPPNQEQSPQDQGQGGDDGPNSVGPQQGAGTGPRADAAPVGRVSPGFAHQVARAHGGPAGASTLLAALANHVLPGSRAA